MSRPPKVLVTRVSLCVYAAFVLAVTLRPTLEDTGVSGLGQKLVGLLHGWGVPAWFDYNALEFVANVAMFVPLGVLLALSFSWRGWSWVGAAAVPFALSVLIEAVQLTLPDRVSDVRDLLANGLGGVIGIALGALNRRPASRTMEDHARTEEPCLTQ